MYVDLRYGFWWRKLPRTWRLFDPMSFHGSFGLLPVNHVGIQDQQTGAVMEIGCSWVFSRNLGLKKVAQLLTITTNQVGVWTKHLLKHQVEPSQKPKYQTYQPRLVSLVIRWCFRTPRLEAKRGGSTTAWLYEAGRASHRWLNITGVIWSNNFFSDMYFAGGTILWEIGFWKLNPFYHVRYC